MKLNIYLTTKGIKKDDHLSHFDMIFLPGNLMGKIDFPWTRSTVITTFRGKEGLRFGRLSD